MHDAKSVHADGLLAHMVELALWWERAVDHPTPDTAPRATPRHLRLRRRAVWRLLRLRIKRAYKLDDFASIIPGHGGVFDRVDCQLIMGLATQSYYATFIGPSAILSVNGLLQLAASLSADDRLEIYKALGSSLKAEGLIR